ncbi:MAG: phosphatase PAP2 family protein [Planctomycetes bacterium]|nr:phosphatase PAP2 family protein [Planctomycetota bacterium]
MSWDSRLKLIIIAGTGLLGVSLCMAVGIQLSLAECKAPLAVVACLGPFAYYYQCKQTPQFVICLLAVIQFLVFTACFTLLMYACAALSFPYVDELLMTSDRMLGVHVPDIVGWAADHPHIAYALFLAYHSVLPQTLLLLIGLGFAGDRRPLELFVLRFMLALLITVAIFTVTPAEGPFVTYGLEISAAQDRVLEHLQTLRSGERTSISLADSEGLVMFPSFHTTFAILLAASVWHRKRLFIPFALLNAACIAATMTTGWHYFTDVLGGILVAVLVIVVTNRAEPWLAGTKPNRRASDRRLTTGG